MTNVPAGPAAPRSSTTRPPRPSTRIAATGFLVAILAACSPGPGPTGTAGPGASGGPTTGPTPSPAVPTGGLEHPTGATDVVLRFEEGGGLVPVEWSATYAPSFTLYGDGTVIFRDPYAVPPEPIGNVQRAVPFMTVRLGEEAIQALLEEGLGPGGLAVATGPYMGMGADIPTATFTISVGGKTKQVSVTGLSPDMHPQNQAIVRSLAAFAEKLRTFGDQVGGELPYEPAGYRGVLISADQPLGPVVAWPWAALTPADFGGENEFFRTRVMTPAEVNALGIDGIQGGMLGVSLQAQGKLYTFSLRVLLPDETK